MQCTHTDLLCLAAPPLPCIDHLLLERRTDLVHIERAQDLPAHEYSIPDIVKHTQVLCLYPERILQVLRQRPQDQYEHAVERDDNQAYDRVDVAYAAGGQVRVEAYSNAVGKHGQVAEAHNVDKVDVRVRQRLVYNMCVYIIYVLHIKHVYSI